MGVHPGPDLDACAAAALIGTSTEQAKGLLGQLARAHLIQGTRAGRYAMHDLLSAYARELASAEKGNEWRAALTRLLDTTWTRLPPRWTPCIRPKKVSALYPRR